MNSHDFNCLYREIALRLRSYQHEAQVTRPCILAPSPPKMILGSTEEMDPELWGNLQYHIDFERIFAKLPFQEFFQLRLVCKDFNARASDEKFLEANANPLSKKPFFCLVHPRGIWQLFVEYDPVSNEWHQLPIPTPHGTNNDYPPMWSASGYLVFAEDKRPDDWIFLVFDLSTRMLHKLPPLYKDRALYPIMYWNLEGLIVNQVDNTFRLVIVEMETKETQTIQTFIYDSATRAWDQKVQPFPLGLNGIEEFLSLPHGNVCHNGNLYVSMREAPFIMSYDLATSVWSYFQGPFEDSSLGCWNGRLYAVSSVLDARASCIVEFYVHQLFGGINKRWGEVCSIPLDLYDELFKNNDPSPTQNECHCCLETYVQASFCDKYVLVSVFLEDYFVFDSGCDGYKIWYSGTLVPRRFALLNLETEKWERLDFPISRDRQRMEMGIEDCGFASCHRKVFKKMIKLKLKER